MFKKIWDFLFNRKKYVEVEKEIPEESNTEPEVVEEEEPVLFNVELDNRHKFLANKACINTRHKFYRLTSDNGMELYIRMLFKGNKKVSFGGEYLSGIDVQSFICDTEDSIVKSYKLYIKVSNIINNMTGCHKLPAYPELEDLPGGIEVSRPIPEIPCYKIEFVIPYKGEDIDEKEPILLDAFLIMPYNVYMEYSKYMDPRIKAMIG